MRTGSRSTLCNAAPRCRASAALFVAVLALAALAPVVVAQAPTTIGGRTFEVTITSGTPPLASNGVYRFLPAATGLNYFVVRISGDVDTSYGTYTYTKTGANTATVTFTDLSIGAGFAAAITFSTATSGTLKITSPLLPGSFQEGRFVVLTGESPASIAGTSFDVTVTDGEFPFAFDGSFRLNVGTDGRTYSITGSGGVANSSGTVTVPYAKTSPTTGAFTVSDSLAGSASVQLTFASAAGGSYVAIAVGSSAYQTGVFTARAPVAPKILTQPQSQSVVVGSSVVLSVSADGTAPLSYQWKKDNANVSDGGRIQGALTQTLTISNVQPGDAGSYSAVVKNAAGSATSVAASLAVLVPPAITTQPASQTVSAGATVVFSVTATGTSPLKYQWKRNGIDVPGGTGPTLTINNVSANQAGTYTVAVSNTAGSLTSAPATLTVTSTATAPSITVQPVSQAVKAGSDVTFSVQAAGTPPLTYQWKKDGVNVTGATLPTLLLHAVTASDAATYTVEIRNSAGPVTSNPATLTVQPAISVLRFLAVRLKPGNAIELTHEVEIGKTYSIEASLNLGNWTEVHRFTAAGSPSQFTDTTAGQAVRRFYRLRSVSVGGKPIITRQPESQFVLVGDRVTFSVEASGTPPFTYQWRKNGVDLSGRTASTFVISPARLTSAGTYTVVVRNALGEVVSEPAELDVEPGG